MGFNGMIPWDDTLHQMWLAGQVPFSNLGNHRNIWYYGGKDPITIWVFHGKIMELNR